MIAARRGESECILWPHPDLRVRRGSYARTAHYVICTIAHGNQIEHDTVRRCVHNPWCVNPDHLAWRNGALSAEDIICIRLLYAHHPVTLIARAFGITEHIANRILTGLAYARVRTPAQRFDIEYWRQVVRMEDAASCQT